MKAIIIGGGIGGLSAALALARIGWEAEVYERATALGEVGAGIGLGANAITALRRIGADGPVIAAGEGWARAEIRASSGRLLIGVDLRPIQRRLGAPILILHRAELVEALHAQLPRGTVRFGRVFERYEQNAAGVTAHFRDGSTARGDILIGADGLQSAVRAQLLGPEPPVYAGYTCWRSIVPFPVSAVAPAGYVCEVWGRGQRFGIVRASRGRVYWFATSNTAPTPADAPRVAQKPHVQGLFAGWMDPIPRLLEATPEEACLRNDIYDRPPAPRWSEGRVVIIGDAAHPTTPNLGQGGGMAIEDAVVLARVLARGGDIPAALGELHRTRRGRTRSITIESRRLGQVGQWTNPALCRVRDAVFALTPRAVTVRNMLRHQLYDPGPV